MLISRPRSLQSIARLSLTQLGFRIVHIPHIRNMSAGTTVDSSTSEHDLKRPVMEDKTANHRPVKTRKVKLKKYKAKKVDETSPLGVLQFEIDELLSKEGLTREQILNDMVAVLNHKDIDDNPMSSHYHREVSDVPVLQIGASGDGLAVISNPVETEKKQVVVVPFALPGDVVRIRVFKTHPYFVESDLLEVLKNSPLRQDDLIKCRYFGKCAGCQFQFLTYDEQLKLKKETVFNAYKYFAPQLLAKEMLPVVGDTVASPKMFDYRTKLTPHFDMPKKVSKLEERPPLGFGQKGRPSWRNNSSGGTKSILDIEECVIGTKIINEGMANERKRFERDYKNYKRGATILLRENTRVLEAGKPVEDQLGEGSQNITTGQTSFLEVMDDKPLAKTCVTKSRQVVTEYINGYTFEFSAGEFFQNNNSILPKVTDYVCSNLQIANSKPEDPHYLVDAYCGSGLFSITASKGVDKVIGVEVSADSVSFAERNAKANGVKNCEFVVGKAECIFASIDTPSDRTSVILDPPRKGCDDVFLKQLAEYNPARIVYISCNVHSQARDMQYFLQETEKGKAYKIESLRGFDFFPQTHHVESVCVLSRI
ncbi:LANO_0G05160g1_1 [Lachancea nothofagi CBS 11611]|uniref:tRNA (uracil(54)-C(5))-methyltransferase n=1 Tax=Lachancea nothofagi CBS 11611 TaxID=1266666 RepID=A0A1G4KGN3_9SACH|nr:LANO_0G05160g1_1 [Lachancea nothofagi CBS 11611]